MHENVQTHHLSLTQTRIHAGYWEGVLTADTSNNDYQPELEVTHLGQPVSEVELQADEETEKSWHIRISIPTNVLSEGAQTFLIRDKKTEATLEHFTIVTGQPLEEDIRAEINLMRAELDMLKKIFRRHFSETRSESTEG